MDDLLKVIGVLTDLGGTAIVTVMLYVVWLRLTELTDRFIDILAEIRSQALRDELAKTTNRNST